MAGFKGLKKFLQKFDKKTTKVLHDVSRIAFYNLVTGSPVDKGNFRARWLGSAVIPRVGNPYNLPYEENPGNVALGTPTTAEEAGNFQPALKAKFGQDVYITNNLHYADKLENGGSSQAPSGILKVQVQKTRAQISRKFGT